METEILAALPGSYKEICTALAPNHHDARTTPAFELKVDRELQKLRKAGKIQWERRGRSIIWSKVV